MKKAYETPVADKVAFLYKDHIVASMTCKDVWVNVGDDSCTEGNKHQEHLPN